MAPPWQRSAAVAVRLKAGTRSTLAFLATSIVVAVVAAAAECPCEARAGVLLDVLQGLNGDASLLGWNVATSSVCEWPGVVCDGSDVSGIDLRSQGLTGTIPGGPLSQLTALTTLDVSNNSLRGTLPLSLQRLAVLRVFNVSTNSLTGTLPNAYANWTQLRVFLVDNNDITGPLPEAYGAWGSSIRVVQVDGNRLSGTLPDAYGAQWPSIHQLDVSDNFLQGTVPSSFSNWKELTSFSCRHNNLNGSLTPSTEGWARLASLKADNNSFSGTLPQLHSAATPKQLLLAYNQFSGTLPTEWSRFGAYLEQISLSSNRISGTLPPQYAAFVSLEDWLVSGNLLHGTLPAEYAQWSSLRDIDLQDNQFSGTLPAAWGAGWRNVRRVWLSNNSALSGSLPDAWSQWTSLRLFSATHIGLSGTLPLQYSAWTQLDNFRISDTQLSGTLPPSLSAWRSIESLRIRSNKLTGTLPTEYGDAWQRLRFLRLEDNQLSGTLPASWARMRRLETLSLFANHLEGTLPPEFSQMPSLSVLGLAVNRFSGTLPSSWGSGTLKLLLLALQNNSGLTGTLPSSWRQLFPLPYSLISICNTSLCGAASSVGLLNLYCLPREAMFLEDTVEIYAKATMSASVPCNSIPNHNSPAPWTRTRSIPIGGNDVDATLLSASMLAEVQTLSSVAGIGSGVAAALVGVDPGDVQMLSSVLGSSCMCGNVAAATSSMSYSRTPFVELGIVGVVVGNVALAGVLCLIHAAAVALMHYYDYGVRWSMADALAPTTRDKASDRRHHRRRRGRRGREVEAASAEERLRFPNLSVRCVVFLLCGVLGNCGSLFFSAHSVGRVAAGVFAVLGIGGACWVLESRIYQRCIVNNHKFRYHTYQPQIFHPVPHVVAANLLPRGCWTPVTDRKTYGSLVSSLTHHGRRAWVAMPLINAGVQLLASVPVGNSAGCDALQSVIALVAVGGSAFFIVVRPHRIVIASLAAGASLWLVSATALLGMLCRHNRISSSSVTTFAMCGSFLLVASKALVFAIPFVEQRLLLLKNLEASGEVRRGVSVQEIDVARNGDDTPPSAAVRPRRILAVPSPFSVPSGVPTSSCGSEPIPELFLNAYNGNGDPRAVDQFLAVGDWSSQVSPASSQQPATVLKHLIELVCDAAADRRQTGPRQ